MLERCDDYSRPVTGSRRVVERELRIMDCVLEKVTGPIDPIFNEHQRRLNNDCWTG